MTNPSVLFEVLSPGTEDCVVIAQDRRHIELWQRREDRSWSHRIREAGDTTDLAPIRCQVTVDELYADAGIT